MSAREVIWHDIECGSYRADLPLWRTLARRYGDPILEIGAGTGRVSLDLAGLGYDVTALDCDGDLLGELGQRAGSSLRTVVADARSFTLERRFALCIVPMQAVQLLGGSEERAAFLGCARECLVAGGVLAIALTEIIEEYSVGEGAPPPVPDVRELDGVLYASRPVAVRSRREGFVIERVREIVAADGSRQVHEDRVVLDRLRAAELEREGRAAGYRVLDQARVSATVEYVGSEVVVLGA